MRLGTPDAAEDSPTVHSLMAIEPALLFSVAPAGDLNSSAGDLFQRIWPTLLVLAAVAIVGGLFAMWLRRRLASKDEGATAGFTLEDLRRLHRSGEMSDEEFAKAKEAMLAHRPSRESMADKLVQPRRGNAAGSGPEPRVDDRDNPPPQKRKG